MQVNLLLWSSDYAHYLGWTAIRLTSASPLQPEHTGHPAKWSKQIEQTARKQGEGMAEDCSSFQDDRNRPIWFQEPRPASPEYGTQIHQVLTPQFKNIIVLSIISAIQNTERYN